MNCLKKISIAIALISFTFIGEAQEDSTNNLGVTLTIGITGEFIIHPGIQFGVYKPVRQVIKNKERKNGPTTRSLLVSGDVLAYIHPNSHYGLLLEGGCKLRFTGHRKMFREISFDAGYFHQFNWGTTYEMNDDGEIEIVRAAGRAYFMPSTSFSVGNTSKRNPQLGWYTGLKIGVQMPYNTAAIPKVFIHGGINYTLKKRS